MIFFPDIRKCFRPDQGNDLENQKSGYIELPDFQVFHIFYLYNIFSRIIDFLTKANYAQN